jgi:hypothetical protein
MSAKGQKRTWADLFDYFISALLEMQRHGKAERLGGLHVDHEIEFSWQQNWKISRLFTLEDSSGVIACLPIRIGDAGTVADQAASEGILSKVIHGGQTILCRERNDPIASSIEVCIGGDEQGADPLLEEKREGRVQFLVIASFRYEQAAIDCLRALLKLSQLKCSIWEIWIQEGAD